MRPFGQLLAVLFLVGLLLRWWWVFVIAMGLWLGARWMLGVWKASREAAARDRERWRVLATRAEEQDRLYLAGDPRGIYGEMSA